EDFTSPFLEGDPAVPDPDVAPDAVAPGMSLQRYRDSGNNHADFLLRPPTAGAAAPANHAPQADVLAPAGEIRTGVAVTFDASPAADADGDTFTFVWAVTDPNGTDVTPADASGPTVTITGTLAGPYTAALVLTDVVGASSLAGASVTYVTNLRPIAV